MAGHSKFKNIMHRKSAQDMKRAKVFSNHLRAISIAAKEGVDIEINFKLRNAIALAKADNVPKENIERILNKSTDVSNLEEVRYGGYVANSVAVIIETITNNRNRTVKEIRNVLNHSGGSIAEFNAVAFLFSYCCIFSYAKTLDFDSFLELVLDCTIKDCFETEQSYQIIATFDQFNQIKTSLEKFDLKPLNYQLIWIPNSEVELDPESQKLSVDPVINTLKELDDVQAVFSNIKISDDI